MATGNASNLYGRRAQNNILAIGQGLHEEAVARGSGLRIGSVLYHLGAHITSDDAPALGTPRQVVAFPLTNVVGPIGVTIAAGGRYVTPPSALTFGIVSTTIAARAAIVTVTGLNHLHQPVREEFIFNFTGGVGTLNTVPGNRIFFRIDAITIRSVTGIAAGDVLYGGNIVGNALFGGGALTWPPNVKVGLPRRVESPRADLVPAQVMVDDILAATMIKVLISTGAIVSSADLRSPANMIINGAEDSLHVTLDINTFDEQTAHIYMLSITMNSRLEEPANRSGFVKSW